MSIAGPPAQPCSTGTASTCDSRAARAAGRRVLVPRTGGDTRLSPAIDVAYRRSAGGTRSGRDPAVVVPQTDRHAHAAGSIGGAQPRGAGPVRVGRRHSGAHAARRGGARPHPQRCAREGSDRGCGEASGLVFPPGQISPDPNTGLPVPRGAG